MDKRSLELTTSSHEVEKDSCFGGINDGGKSLIGEGSEINGRSRKEGNEIRQFLSEV